MSDPQRDQVARWLSRTASIKLPEARQALEWASPVVRQAWAEGCRLAEMRRRGE